MASACTLVDSGRALWCRNAQAATHLKLVSIGVILATSVAGIASPVVLARFFEGRPGYGSSLLLIKCFAAGVILSTSLVHVMPDAFAALADCQVASRHPWRDFPFSGLVTLIGVLLALLVDLAATSHASAAASGEGGGKQQQHYERIKPEDGPVISVVEDGGKQLQQYEPVILEEGKKKQPTASAMMMMELGACHGHHGGGGGVEEVEEEEEGKKVSEEEILAKLKQKMVSQVLEIGIVFHSVIIGVTMGMSQNQCSIRPLVIALSFHQIFEGMGLGGCIAQAGFGLGTVAYMSIMFAVTTPMGIVLGMIIFYLTGYDDSNPNALIAEGLLGSISAGVLIYMALVDLIAVDFFHNKMMTSSSQLKKASYVALALGSATMSVLALWA